MSTTFSAITVTPVGRVRNAATGTVDTGWGSVESRIELAPAWTGGLDGLGEFSHVIVVTHLHRVAAEEPALPAKRRPRNRPDMPLLGVFSQRARVRPNHIGVTACEVVRVSEKELVVRGLDAIDGTPVLDIKPYVPLFDRVESPRVPAWVDELLRDYL